MKGKRIKLAIPVIAVTLLLGCSPELVDVVDESHNIGFPTAHILRAAGIVNSVELTVEVSPSYATDKRLSWSISDTSKVQFKSDPGTGASAEIYAVEPFTGNVEVTVSSVSNPTVKAKSTISFYRPISDVTLGLSYSTYGVSLQGKGGYEEQHPVLNIQPEESAYVYFSFDYLYPSIIANLDNKEQFWDNYGNVMDYVSVENADEGDELIVVYDKIKSIAVENQLDAGKNCGALKVTGNLPGTYYIEFFFEGGKDLPNHHNNSTWKTSVVEIVVSVPVDGLNLNMNRYEF